MSRAAQEKGWGQRARGLTQMLILSVTLNIGFVATLIYSVLHEREHPLIGREQEELQNRERVLSTNEALLRSYAKLSFEALVHRLEKGELVEEGYKKRDLALACLVAFHHFNVERALGGIALQERKIAFSDLQEEGVVEISIFPGLADYQYQAILHYAKTERWPLTTCGLFFALQRGEESEDASLIDAFTLTPEYHALFTLFGRSGSPLAKELLIALFKQGDWLTFARLAEEQRQNPECTPERRRALLLSYLERGSQVAAEILLQVDAEFISRRFSDEQLLFLLQKVGQPTPGLKDFLHELLGSLRSDAVLKESALKLYALEGESPPEPYQHRLALERFAPDLAVDAPAHPPSPSPPPPPKRFYTVQPGDSLWKVARTHNTSIDWLKQCNQLESDRLRPGQRLEVP